MRIFSFPSTVSVSPTITNEHIFLNQNKYKKRENLTLFLFRSLKSLEDNYPKYIIYKQTDVPLFIFFNFFFFSKLKSFFILT